MKKILILLVAAFVAISCLNGGSYSQSYTADITFDFTNSSWFKDSLYVMSDGEAFMFGSYPIFFYQKQENGTFQGGFLISYLKGEPNGELNKEPMSNDAYRVHAATGALSSGVIINGSPSYNAYAVYYDNPNASMMPKYDIEFGYRELGTFTPYGCYVNNTTLVARKIQEHFKDGDKLVLKATGVTAGGIKRETSITLAEYTEAKDSVMYNWTPFTLSSLGTVEYIELEIESTCPEVPGYVCIDGLLAGVTVEY